MSALIETAFARHQCGAVTEAEPLYRQALDIEPNNLNALQLLGALLLEQRRAAEALPLLRSAVAALEARGSATEQHGSLYFNLGNAQQEVGLHADALETYTRGVAIAPANVALHDRIVAELLRQGDAAAAAVALERALPLMPGNAEWLHNFGSCLVALGRAEDAVAQFRLALSHAPGQLSTLRALASALISLDRPAEAIGLYEALVAIAPDHAETHAALGTARLRLMQIDLALESFRRHLQLVPRSAAAHFQLGRALSAAGRHGEACPFFEAAIRLDTASTLRHSAHLLYGVALQHLGKLAESRAQFREALAQKQVVTLPSPTRRSAAGGANLSVLFLMAPGLYNTPYEFLIQQADYDVHFLFLVPDHKYDVDALRPFADLVVNLVSDAEHNDSVLPIATSLVARLAKPTINRPDKIAITGRAAMALRLSGIAGCRVARISSHTGSALLEPGFLARTDLPPLPFLVRRAGSHNGEEFEKIGNGDELRRYAGGDPSAVYHVIEYMDYRDCDGFFRKYRFFFVGDEMLPYHLAIGADWKVHHVSTEMSKHPWMQQEEATFLRVPNRIFNVAQMATLRAIRDAIGLEFFGIDCSIDQAGKIVVFEANATMLVNGDNPEFRYMDAAAKQIKIAFNKLIAQSAAPPRPVCPAAVRVFA